mmetsp:Transcript_14725/g.44492  ORF Transcript_14725/g.44492 Transcript_14725/m.44492 type:complete len:214 (+) Transcript_14725:105-746(+)
MAASTLSAQRAFLVAGPAQASTSRQATRACRSVVVRAQAEGPAQTRRALIGGLMAAAVAVTMPQQAQAVDIIDATKVRQAGFDIIYEARDLDLPQAARDGISQFRQSLEDTKKRLDISAKRINGDLSGYVSKKYWTLAREELRLQTGNLRQDVNTIANTFDKTKKKAALGARDAFNKSVDKLDFAFRSKSAEKADAAYAEVKSNLQGLLSALG